jgi:asparagine synthase (glutamine-hydrolysing)
MAAALIHRGPDEEGFFAEGPVALGHRRLSILDLAGGIQPMSREQCTLVFNGQAYEHPSLRRELEARGHHFTTRSDTEVVLRAYLEWGESFVEHVHGMFALAIWDNRSRKLILARDRMGKKPLYYVLGNGSTFERSLPSDRAVLNVDRVIFGSELKSLLARGDIPRELDHQAFLQYLAAEYVPAPLSILDRVRKLPAAHVAVLDAKGFRIRRYWEIPSPAPRAGRSDPSTQNHQGTDDASKELLRLLDQSVARRLVADVPVGVFLSGGVDSTTIAALAVRHQQPLDTFNIAFSEVSFDESAFAQLAAERLGTTHHVERLAGNACLDELPRAVEQLDEPFADPSILPTLLLSRFARKRVKVALAGDGGDELFAGYDTFLAHRPAQVLALLPPAVRTFLARAVDRLPPADTNMSLDFRLKQFFKGLSAPPTVRHQAWIGSFVPQELEQVVHPELRPLAKNEIVYREVLQEVERSEQAGVASGSVDEALRFYFERYLTDDILVKADRASMAASLELRAPFLDTHVVEFAAKLPWREKLGLSQTKVLLKRALRGLVPEEILSRPKKGFGIPVAAWIRGPLRSLFEDLFSPGSLRQANVFDVAATRLLLDRHLRNEADLRKPLWTVALFLLWQRRWTDRSQRTTLVRAEPERTGASSSRMGAFSSSAIK